MKEIKEKILTEEDLEFLRSKLDLLTEPKDIEQYNYILAKISNGIDHYAVNRQKASARITEIRKVDKLYGRDKKTIQGHFNRVVKEIHHLLLIGSSREARRELKQLVDDARLPRYRVYLDNALGLLSKEELKFLNWE